MKHKQLGILVLLSVFLSCEELAMTPDISKLRISLLAPANGSIVSEGNVIFSWEDISDAEAYQIQVATPNFENASQILADTIVPVTSFTTELMQGAYQWRVKGRNDSYETEYSSNNFTVTSDSIP